jgi:hypothetical protein
MKILMQKSVMIDGKKVRAGEQVEVSERFARELLAQGRAIPAPEKVETVNRSVGLETSEEPKPVARRKTTPRKKKIMSDGD